MTLRIQAVLIGLVMALSVTMTAGCYTAKTHEMKFAEVKVKDTAYDIESRKFEMGMSVENRTVSGTKTVSGSNYPWGSGYMAQVARDGTAYSQAKRDAVLKAEAHGLLETLVEGKQTNSLYIYQSDTVTVYGKPFKYTPLGAISPEREERIRKRVEDERLKFLKAKGGKD